MFKKVDIEKIGTLAKIFTSCVCTKDKKNKSFFILYLSKMLPFIDIIQSYTSDVVLVKRSFCRLHVRKDNNTKSVYLKNTGLYTYRK